MPLPKTPFIQWREQPDRSIRPRFAPSSREIRLGFSTVSLKHPDGRWFSFEETRTWLYGADGKSGVYAAIVKARRDQQKGKRTTLASAPARPRRTIADLLEDWATSDEFKGLKPASQSSYRKGVDAILYRPQSRADAAAMRARIKAAKLLGVAPPVRAAEPIASATPSSLGKPELRAFFNYLRDARGHHMALAVIATLSAALTWGQESVHWRLGPNPRDGMEFERPEGRVVLVTMVEFTAWVAAADALGRPSIGDSLYLALFTGQRQTDRLAMRFDDDGAGRFTFRQSKTGEMVDIKHAPQLTARLDQARARIAKLKLNLGLRDMPAEIVINEATGARYDESTYRHWVAAARDLAVKGSDEQNLAPCPSLLFVNARGEPDAKHDQDLRDTCVMLLDRAGCDLLTICDITGHSYKSAQTIVKHYRARNPDRADQGIDALVLQVRKEGLTG